jgi:glycosyltransferase involved in cell wall biosynthesis
LKKLYTYIQFKKFYNYESKLFGYFDRCLAITEEDGARMRRMNPKAKVSVIPAGVDTSYFRPMNEPVERYSIVSTASMDWPPNSEGILWFADRVWPVIKREIPQAKFYVVGRNPPRRIERLSAEEDITVTGFVDDVREYMARAAVMIVPLRVGGGMRIKLLNAFAMGKAVVSTPVGCEGIDVEDGRNIRIAEKSGEFARLTIELLKDERKREALEREGLNLVRNRYRWEQIAEQLEKEYKEIVKEGT